MINYKNVVFDFGNVIAKFDEDYILGQFCESTEDLPILKQAVFHNWAALDEGTADYKSSMEEAAMMVPDHLKGIVRDFSQNWHKYLTPLNQTWDLIRQLKSLGLSIYLLSNAPTHFAEHADYYKIIQEFDGIAFSAPLVMAKPDTCFYQYLFDTWQLKPEECLFIDDKPENIAAGMALGMDGIVFTGNADEIRRILGI